MSPDGLPGTVRSPHIHEDNGTSHEKYQGQEPAADRHAVYKGIERDLYCKGNLARDLETNPIEYGLPGDGSEQQGTYERCRKLYDPLCRPGKFFNEKLYRDVTLLNGGICQGERNEYGPQEADYLVGPRNRMPEEPENDIRNREEHHGSHRSCGEPVKGPRRQSDVMLYSCCTFSSISTIGETSLHSSTTWRNTYL